MTPDDAMAKAIQFRMIDSITGFKFTRSKDTKERKRCAAAVAKHAQTWPDLTQEEIEVINALAEYGNE